MATLFEKVLQKVQKKFEKSLIKSFERFQEILRMFKNYCKISKRVGQLWYT